ncbi:RNA-guided endonuclease InsQ/TnpB family protein [Mahella australiensis]|uniref:RNA-guided endonuclease InsQ/TnpB family protein n=1 Tax=Mahella australiensis TaxID=252966 RepID=UPI0002E326E9|nr:RNA-guided endonuclease TnpB family protein [Mahella australiensis]
MRLKKNKPNAKQRVIQFELNPNKEQCIILSALTYASSKLWNVANYERITWTKESGNPYPDWYEQKARLKESFWYKNLPSQTAQEVLKQLDEAWSSFYKLKKTGGIENPRPPKYKHSNFNIRYLNKGFVISDGVIRLTVPKQQKLYMKQKYVLDTDFLYIQIPDRYKNFAGKAKVIEIIPIPRSNKYKINIIVDLPATQYQQDNAIYMAIDLGVNNLMTCYTSTGKSMIISGRQLLSINRYFDKEIAHHQSITYAQQATSEAKYKKSSRRIQQLYTKRKKQVHHLLHTATKQVIDFAEQEGVAAIIIGDLSHIRDDKDMGKVNNQKVHKWPFKKVEELLTYKTADRGIFTDKQEESYTSQCSPYATEVSEASAQKSNRKYRGLYVVDSKTYNADCVGAYNILKKYLCRVGKPNPAVVALDPPEMYRWNGQCFIGNQKLANLLAM